MADYLQYHGYPEEHDVPEGWNPDDWADYPDELDFMRRDVEGYERFLSELGHDHGPNSLEGDVAEDTSYFQEAIATHPAHKRRATTRKSKKLFALSQALDGDDWQRRQVLRGEPGGRRIPPTARRGLSSFSPASLASPSPWQPSA